MSDDEDRLKKIGGGNRDRTCDLLNANQMLSQLSYAPTRKSDIANLIGAGTSQVPPAKNSNLAQNEGIKRPSRAEMPML